MNSPLVVGFLTSFALIAAIGAQNAFVLRQGIRREHVLPVVAMCALSDIVLIAAGIAGVGALVTVHPDALSAAKSAARRSSSATDCWQPNARTGPPR